MKRKLTCLVVFMMLSAIVSNAQEWVREAFFDFRMDYNRTYQGHEKDAEASGFKGSYSNFTIGGQIAPDFTYMYRQRFTKSISNGGFLEATDYMYLDYKASDRWSIRAGKQDAKVGGFEYDYIPINYYFLSEYIYQLSCYHFGVTAFYRTGEQQFLAQVSQSPFKDYADDMYGFSLMWIGKLGCYQTLWSTNLFEYQPGRYIHYIALGNRLSFNRGYVFADYTNRYARGNGASYFGDFSATAEIHVNPVDKLTLFGKYSYEINKDNAADYCVFPGTELHSVGGGLEFFPIRDSRKVRLHAGYYYSWGTNTNESAVLKQDGNYLKAGLTWRFDLTHLKVLDKK